jgi:hypothetical protein
MSRTSDGARYDGIDFPLLIAEGHEIWMKLVPQMGRYAFV